MKVDSLRRLFFPEYFITFWKEDIQYRTTANQKQINYYTDHLCMIMLYRSVTLIFLVCCLQPGEQSEHDILKKIFENYERRVRPVRNHSQSILVQVQLNIISLLEVNGPQEYIKLVVNFYQLWRDDFLRWDPLEFNGTKDIKVPADMVWRPDVTVVSTDMEDGEIIKKEDRWLEIQYSGDILLSFPIVLTNHCPMKTDRFPFDSQECTIILSSWTYPSEEMMLEDSGGGMIQNPNTEWEVFPYESETTMFFDGKKNFSNLLYRQKIKRKSTYYMYVIIVPTFIITALSIAGILAPFSNTGEREERTTLGLTTLLTLAVILSIVTGEMPRATNLPVLGHFILVEICICVVSIALSVCTMFLHQRATTRHWKGADSEPKKYNECANNHEKLDGMGFWQLNKSILKLNNLLEQTEANDERNNRWTIIFDQCDLIFFIIFQIAHTIYFFVLISEYM